MTAPNAFSYHPETREYLGPVPRQQSPEEEDVFWLPAFAAEDEPFLQPGPQQAIARAANDGGWELVADLRGVTYWTPEGEEITIDRIGVEKPANALDARPVTVLDQMEQKRSLLDLASNKIATYMDAVDPEYAPGGVPVAGAAEALTAWRRFRVAVNAVDVQTIPAAWPATPEV